MNVPTTVIPISDAFSRARQVLLRKATFPVWFGILLTVALMVARTPYRGVRHDGILYLAQAYAHLDPGWASKELFFVGGFQDRYSVLSNLVAFALSHASVGITCLTLLICAWSLNLVALYALGSELPKLERWLAVIAVVSASHYYGAARMISYFENFLTARTWAEPFALLALASFVAGKRRWAGALLVLAALMHPLITLPVVLVIFCLLVGEERRWLLALLLAVPVLALAAFGVTPFDGLLRVYDEDWFAATHYSNSAVFLTEWSATDFMSIGVFLVVLWIANRGIDTSLARASRTTAGVAVALCAISYLGADLLRDILITQLQLWRALWIANLLAMFTLPSWLVRLYAQGPSGRLAASAILVAVVTADAWVPTGWALSAWAIVAAALHRHQVVIKPSISRLAMAATLLAGLMLCLLQVLNAQGQLSMHAQGMTIARPISIPFTLPLLTLPLALALMLAWQRGHVIKIAAATIGTVAILLIGLSQWDQRTPWERYIEETPRGTHPFDAIVPPGAQVYWHDDIPADWFLLGRPHFVGLGQFSGVLFSRQTAEVGLPRLQRLRDIMANEDGCKVFERFGADASMVQACKLPHDAFLAMCRGESDHADFLVASTDFGTGVVARWTFAPRDARPVTYALYDCRRVNEALGHK